MPTAPHTTALSSSSIPQAFPEKLNYLISQYLSDPRLGAPMLCKLMGLSRTKLYRQVKACTGLSVNRYIRQCRLQRARNLLQTTQGSLIKEICYEVGFSDPSYFNRSFRQAFHVTPGSLRYPQGIARLNEGIARGELDRFRVT